ncbi:MAG: hypothetical protein KGL39_29110 [Patescibacteria group bacterium]|nr:hypothetical protein [Patescibacteria group bacterium]
MTDAFRGNAEQVKAGLASEGIKYGISIGRRAPMHRMHVDCLREIKEAGLTPVVFIGSTNGPDSPLYDPIRNPLTLEQQREQLRIAVPDLYDEKRILTLPDYGAPDLWFDNFFAMIGETDFAGRAVAHYRSKASDAPQAGGSIRPLSSYMDGFISRDLPAWESFNRNPADDNINASDLRKLDLEHLTPEQRAIFAAPDYIIGIAKKARANNPDSALLDEAHIPVTVLDLSFDRLRKEAGISTHEILERAKTSHGFLTLGSLSEASIFLIKDKVKNRSLMAIKNEPLRLKIASASCNQTAYDFATNLPNILKAVDKAVEDGADILSLQEMGLTGYAADDYHQWFKNDQVWDLIQTIAAYASEKNPNLVISLGSPWYYENKNLPAHDPVYNIEKKPYNCQFTITGGKVVAISAKSILAEGPAEYERHQFTNWPFKKGSTRITLPDGSTVPFGKPVIALEKDGVRATLMHEQCAEGWPGVNDDLTINEREQNEARHIVTQAKTHDLTVVINPSASKPQPAINKERIRADGLCKSGSKHCGVFVYTNYLGSESGTYAAEGSQIFAQNGKIIQHGQRYTFKDVSYSSTVVEVPPAKRGEAHVTVSHGFKAHERKNVGAEAVFEKAYGEELMHEEYARSISLWLRDYMAKQPFPCQGFVISLSGGQDSAYGAVAVSTMVDLEVKENGVKGFFEHFPKLKYKDEVLKTLTEQGEEVAVDAIKKNLLTCVYLPTDNSGETTRNAARFLIEGGELNGKRVKGIGGTFYIANVQGAVDEYIIAYSGMDMDKVAKEHLLRQGKHNPSTAELEHGRDEVKRIIKAYVNSERGSNPSLPDYIADSCTKPLPTWANPADDITMQNIQARARLPVPWTVGNKEGKIALVTSNESEAVLGYTTAGGDMHMGGANPIGGLPKDTLSAGLRYMQSHGLEGLHPIESLHYVTIQKPTAELRKAKEGEKEQTDEGDLGFSYAQSRIMEDKIITGRGLPSAVHASLKGHNLFPSDDIERRDIIAKFCNRWAAAQFKRVMGTLAPYVGGNVDPHQSVRTTVLADHFRTDLAQLTLNLVADRLGGKDKFGEHFGVGIEKARTNLKMNRALKEAFCAQPIDRLCASEHQFLFNRPDDVKQAAAL